MVQGPRHVPPPSPPPGDGFVLAIPLELIYCVLFYFGLHYFGCLLFVLLWFVLAALLCLLCFMVLRCALLCCAVLCCTLFCSALSYFDLLCCGCFFFAVLCCVLLRSPYPLAHPPYHSTTSGRGPDPFPRGFGGVWNMPSTIK